MVELDFSQFIKLASRYPIWSCCDPLHEFQQLYFIISNIRRSTKVSEEAQMAEVSRNMSLVSGFNLYHHSNIVQAQIHNLLHSVVTQITEQLL